MDNGPGKPATVDAAPLSPRGALEAAWPDGEREPMQWLDKPLSVGRASGQRFVQPQQRGSQMKAQICSFVIIALNREFKDETEEKGFWYKYGFQYKKVYGVYKGEHERSYVIPVDPDEGAWDVGALRSIAYCANQESILVVHGDGSAFLHYTSDQRYGEVEYLGQWRDVPESVAKGSDCYTYDPQTGKYYLAG